MLSLWWVKTHVLLGDRRQESIDGQFRPQSPCNDVAVPDNRWFGVAHAPPLMNSQRDGDLERHPWTEYLLLTEVDDQWKVAAGKE